MRQEPERIRAESAIPPSRFPYPALMFLLSLAACTGTPPRAPEPESGAPSGPAAGRPGGYYQDDGPGDNPPGNLDAIQDAEPRVEPLHRYANNPYAVFGQQYLPMKAHAPFRQRGLASWYGKKFHGQRTASGERYDMYAMTAAHPTLPIPSYVRVTNVRTAKSVIVRINDRGPFHSGRVIDLSYTAAHKLGFVRSGSGMVDVEAILPQDVAAMAERKQNIGPARNEGPSEASSLTGAGAGRDVAVSASAADAAPAAVDNTGVYLQLGAFSSRPGAESLRTRIRTELTWLQQAAQVMQKDGLFRLHLGPYRSRAEAAGIAARIREALQLNPVVVSN
jgi:rare lipoprotein A